MSPTRQTIAKIEAKNRRLCQANAEARSLLDDATRGFIRRIPGKARAIELIINPDWIPPLDRPFR